MSIVRIILIGLLPCTDGEKGPFQKSMTRSYGEGLIPFTPIALNQARFLRLQRITLGRLSARQDQKKAAGAPMLICGEGVMGIIMRDPFNGRIFSSHREKDPECLQYVTKNTLPKFLTSLDGQCGVWSKKSLMSSTTDFHLRIVVSFDYEYLTEEDKIYDLTCSYSSQNISVNAYYDTINFAAQSVRNSSVLPTCHYSLRLNSPDGMRIHTAKIGQLVYHRWSCPSEEFSFKVYRCYIHNGEHQSYLIINDKGCSLDETILPHPTYDSAKDLVYTASKAFRFTKSRRVYFNCMLSVCHRTDDECMREIPPRCPRTIQKRHLSDEFSVEERLERLKMVSDNTTYYGNERSVEYDEPPMSDHFASFPDTDITPTLEGLSIFKEGSLVPACESSSDNSPWIYVLLTTNFLSILIVILMCSTAVRHRYYFDATKNHLPHQSLF
uniref:ZP domain-containing protein n=1 Tax=Haemonchus contortus TaxID=6289 RepID=A0A7I4Z2C2_HAECO